MPEKKKRRTPPRSTSADPVEQYALDVRDGREIAGPLVRAACSRHLEDLEHGPARGLKWDWPAAARVIGFFGEALRLAGGEHEGRPFLLHPSQKFILGSLFGWKGPDGSRRFRVAYIEQGKGNGKSPLAAGIGLYMMMADGEPRAEVYAAAVDRDQAKVLFRDAVAMVGQSAALDSRITRSGGPGREFNLAHLGSGSFFRPISSESRGRGKSGPRPHCAILDELHEHPTAAMLEFMRAGTKGRRQALIVAITNSGVVDAGSVCMQYHEYAERVLTRQYDDDSFFAYVCGLDAEDDWKDPAVWKKANPLLGVSIPLSYLQEQVREAVGMPSKQSIVRRLNFCEWVQSSDPFVDAGVWEANGGAVDVEALRGRRCFGGLDLSGKNDLTSLTLVFPDEAGALDVMQWFWTPEAGLRERSERDRAPYDRWVEEGWIIARDGKTIDYRWVAQQIGELTQAYAIEIIAFDRWRLDDLARDLDAEDVTVKLVPHGQGFRDMGPAVEALEDHLLESRLRHGGNPVLSWCVSNVRVVTDPANSRKFDKQRSKGRIDGAQSLAMAVNASVIYSQEHKPEPQIFFV